MGAATVCIAMTTYRELLQQTKAEISEVDARAAQDLAGARWIDVREADEWQEGHLPGAVHVPRGYLESRIEGVVPDKSQPVDPLLRGGEPLGLRREDARGARLRARLFAGRRLHRLEAERPRDHDAAHAVAGAAHPLLAPPADSRDRRGRAAEAARRADPADRRRRPRLAGRALPRGCRHRPARDHRRRHRRRDEPAAADRPLARHARHARRSTPRSARSRG